MRGNDSVSEKSVYQALSPLVQLISHPRAVIFRTEKSMRIVSMMLVLLPVLVGIPGASAQESHELLPEVVQHTEPIYPPLARQARIQGEVRVKVTTDGESVRDAEGETGHPLLRKAAEDNTRRWKFVPHTPSTFHVTFRYKLLPTDVCVKFLTSPATVEIEASPPEVIIDYAWISLGTWKAQLKSARGKSAHVFKLSYSGPDGDWLAGDAVGPGGESEEIDFGHKEGHFLAFTITLTQPHGGRAKVFLIGRMTGDRIVGTFVDDAGIRGIWNAVQADGKSLPALR